MLNGSDLSNIMLRFINIYIRFILNEALSMHQLRNLCKKM